MRRVLYGGLLGALPGALLIGVVVVLHTLDVITADQSQIGFIGVPLLFIGVLLGTAVGAAATGSTSEVLAWMGIGLLVGIALSSVLMRVVAGGWLMFVPLLMLGGGVFGAWRHENHTPHPPAIQH